MWRWCLCRIDEYIGEEKLPGVGFGLGDVTLKDFLEVHELMPDFIKCHDLYLAAEDDDLEIDL